ncbi:unnamed protein product [Effrenium voratum]|nr:unnamed protein product [Effrenium voratum]
MLILLHRLVHVLGPGIPGAEAADESFLRISPGQPSALERAEQWKSIEAQVDLFDRAVFKSVPRDRALGIGEIPLDLFPWRWRLQAEAGTGRAAFLAGAGEAFGSKGASNASVVQFHGVAARGCLVSLLPALALRHARNARNARASRAKRQSWAKGRNLVGTNTEETSNEPPKDKRISILGSTGSIGTQTLDICRQFPGLFQVVALAAGKNIPLLLEQVKEFKPQMIACDEPEPWRELSERDFATASFHQKKKLTKME